MPPSQPQSAPNSPLETLRGVQDVSEASSGRKAANRRSKEFYEENKDPYKKARDKSRRARALEAGELLREGVEEILENKGHSRTKK